MKYSLKCNHKKEILKKADEIIVPFEHFQNLVNYFVEYPNQTIILDIPNKNLKQVFSDYIFITLAKNNPNLCCRIYDLIGVDLFKENNIKFYYGYPVSTPYDVQSLIKLGAEYISIEAPLSFDLDFLDRTKFRKFRMSPNGAYDLYIPRTLGICGQWVRPEDVYLYENSIYIFDFIFTSAKEEETLFRVYAEDKTWPGNLNLLIKSPSINMNNRTVIGGLGKARTRCKQRCQYDGSCHLCLSAIDFNELIKNKKFERKTHNGANDE